MTLEQKQALLLEKIQNSNVVIFIVKSLIATAVPSLPEEKVDEVLTAITAYQQTSTFLAESAANFGRKMIYEFAAENIQLGITQDGMTATVLGHCEKLTLSLLTGSLYEAIAQIKTMPLEARDPKYLTAARLTAFCNKLETYLGIPHSTIT